MNIYTQVLEFFMENGITLTPDQMNELKTVVNEITDQQRRQYTRDLTHYNFRGKDSELYDRANKKDEKTHEALRKHGKKNDSYGVSGCGNDLLDTPSNDIYFRNKDGSLKDPEREKGFSYDKNRAKAVEKIIGKAEKEAYKENEKRNK